MCSFQAWSHHVCVCAIVKFDNKSIEKASSEIVWTQVVKRSERTTQLSTVDPISVTEELSLVLKTGSSYLLQR